MSAVFPPIRRRQSQTSRFVRCRADGAARQYELPHSALLFHCWLFRQSAGDFSVRVTNTGAVSGTETAQVYLGLPALLNEPPKRLVGFKKVTLAAGQSQAVEITIDPNSPEHPLSYWNETADRRETQRGNFNFYVGSSSRDLPLNRLIRIR